MIESDISYLVADLKYSKLHELKICEIQHCASSVLTGDTYLNNYPTIPQSFANFFDLTFGDGCFADHFQINKWVTGPICNTLKQHLEPKGWKFYRSMRALANDTTFLELSTLPIDPTNITTYKGIVYGTRDILQDFDIYHNKYPSILFVDATTLPYWTDKYKMNELFNNNYNLKQYKADWQIYPKKYTLTLTQTIHTTLPSEMYVIKPRKEFLANGIIVVTNENLDTTLQTILNPDNNLRKHSNKSYAFWSRNRDETFLIEKYYKSDYLYSTKFNNTYDPTMRIAFILQYNEGTTTYHCLGGYWKLPSKAVNDDTTLNEKCISCCKIPFYEPVEPQLFDEVNEQLEKAMLLLYQVMLTKSNSQRNSSRP